MGMAGVAIDGILDMRILFDKDPFGPNVGIDDHEWRSFANQRSTSSRRRNKARKTQQLAGTIQNDILKEFMVRNTYIYHRTKHSSDR